MSPGRARIHERIEPAGRTSLETAGWTVEGATVPDAAHGGLLLASESLRLLRRAPVDAPLVVRVEFHLLRAVRPQTWGFGPLLRDAAHEFDYYLDFGQRIYREGSGEACIVGEWDPSLLEGGSHCMEGRIEGGELSAHLDGHERARWDATDFGGGTLALTALRVGLMWGMAGIVFRSLELSALSPASGGDLPCS